MAAAAAAGGGGGGGREDEGLGQLSEDGGGSGEGQGRVRPRHRTPALPTPVLPAAFFRLLKSLLDQLKQSHVHTFYFSRLVTSSSSAFPAGV